MKEAYRDQGTVPVVEHTIQDVRLALRQLGQEPGAGRDRDRRAGPRHGRLPGRLRLRRGGAAAAAALPRPGAAGRRHGIAGADPARQPVVPGLPGLEGDEHRVHAASRSTTAAAIMLTTPGGARDRAGDARQRRVLPHARACTPILGRDFARRRGSAARTAPRPPHVSAPGGSASAATPVSSAAASPLSRRAAHRDRRAAARRSSSRRARAPSSGRRCTPTAAAWRGAAATALTASPASSTACPSTKPARR